MRVQRPIFEGEQDFTKWYYGMKRQGVDLLKSKYGQVSKKKKQERVRLALEGFDYLNEELDMGHDGWWFREVCDFFNINYHHLRKALDKKNHEATMARIEEEHGDG